MDVPELQFLIEHEADGGYCASCSLPGEGIYTQGDNLEELHANLEEVVQLYLEGLADDLGSSAPNAATISLKFITPIRKAA
jgi:predicted RNase H-like HicB family nuclease